jgi:hypothetical protein
VRTTTELLHSAAAIYVRTTLGSYPGVYLKTVEANDFPR